MGFKLGSYDMPSSNFKPISECKHVCHITKTVCKPSSKGVPMIVFEFTVQSPAEDRGKKFREWVHLVDEWYGYPRLQALCLAVNPQMKSLDQDPSGFDPESQKSCFDHLLGRLVTIDTKNEKSENGKTYTRVRFGNAQRPGVYVVTAEHRARLFTEIGGEPELPADSRCDFDGIPLIEGEKVKTSIGDDVWGASGSMDDDDIPF